MKTVAALFILCALPTVAAAQRYGWQWQNPNPQGSNLLDVAALSPTTAVAVGDAGQVLRTTDGGATWSEIDSGTYSGLWGVDFHDANIGTAVGHFNTILRTTDGGLTWHEQDYDPVGQTLNDVVMIDAQVGVAVGTNGTILRTEDGDEWMPQTSGTNTSLNAVHFTNASTGTAVGHNGTILRTTDGGAHWDPQDSGQNAILNSVHFVDADVGMAVGFFGLILRTSNGGGTWQQMRNNFAESLHDVWMIDANHASVVGVGILCGNTLSTSDAGQIWSPEDGGPCSRQALTAVSMADAQNGFAVGLLGTLLRTIDGGASWTDLSIGPYESFTDVFFTDAQNGVAVTGGPGAVGKNYWTSDGGVTWTPHSGFNAGGLAVSMPSATTGTAVGQSTIYRTTDGGKTWTFQPSGLGAAFQLEDVDFTDVNTGTAVGVGGTIIRTTNGGTNWLQQNSDQIATLYGVDMVDANVGYAVGAPHSNNGAILKTTNGGTAWDRQDSQTTLFLYGVSFVDADHGWVVGQSATVRRTSDGGVTWTPLDIGLGSFQPDLRRVQFWDLQNGVVVGAGGVILRTKDSGATWTRLLSRTPYNLRGVHFIDPDHGWIAGEFGVLLHTATGGEVSTAIDPEPELARFFVLEQNYPNPFNPRTTIGFSVLIPDHYRIEVYDVLGRRVDLLQNGFLSIGSYEVSWDASARSGGVYFYRLQGQGSSETRRMVLLR